MENVDDNGFTTQIDIGLLGTVIYEVVTGTKCEVDLFQNNHRTDGRAYWPPRKSLPSTQGIWLGWIIEGCWNGQFHSAHDLLEALNSVDPCHSSSISQSQLLTSVENLVRERSIAVMLGGSVLAICAFIAGRKISIR